MYDQVRSFILVRMAFGEVTRTFSRRQRVIEALRIDVALAARIPVEYVSS